MLETLGNTTIDGHYHVEAKAWMPLMGKLLTTLSIFILTATAAHASCFQEAGERYSVSPVLLWAIAKGESSLNPAARNHNRNGTVDVGLMQINSCWADQLGRTWEHLDDPCTNVMTGAWVLHQCVRNDGLFRYAIPYPPSRRGPLPNS